MPEWLGWVLNYLLAKRGEWEFLYLLLLPLSCHPPPTAAARGFPWSLCSLTRLPEVTHKLNSNTLEMFPKAAISVLRLTGFLCIQLFFPDCHDVSSSCSFPVSLIHLCYSLCWLVFLKLTNTCSVSQVTFI